MESKKAHGVRYSALACNRVNVSLKPGDAAIVGQYIGPRLPEGATTLPEGATIKWLLTEVTAP
jgi:hypothetical protein